jgi:transcriptional regulator with XRE-family HTH domain
MWSDPRAEQGAFTVPFVHRDDDLKTRLAYAIRTAREDAGLTRPELARRVGVSRNAVLAWDKGQSVPSLMNLGPLCEALEVSPSLFAFPPPVPPSTIAPFRRPPAGKDDITATG